jgi:signal peptidase I
MTARREAAPRRAGPAHPGRVAGGVLVGFLLALAALRLWVVEPVHVTSDSMVPAVHPGAYALVLATPAARDGLVPGDLVVFEAPDGGSTNLKRVIALGGREVAIRDAVVYVDGAGLREPGIDASAIDGTYFGPLTVPQGSVFVLGDNRGTSVDSRHHGPVPLDRVRGRVLFLWDGAG